MKAFFDIDTQIDFLFPSGALYSRGAERLIAPVARLNALAVKQGIPLISTMCAHPEDADEFKVWAPHCIVRTVGQQKPAATLQSTGQIIVEKNDLDMFSNPRIMALLDEMSIEHAFVYGAFTEYCIQCAVLGLLKAGRKVTLVDDATAPVDAEAGRKAMEEFAATGGSRYEVCQSSQLE